jgi:polyribonucleotide nucleotidyltransferase
MKIFEIDYFGKKIGLESGRMAKQTNTSVVVSYGDTRVLVTAVASKKQTNLGFFPLTCVYQVRKYSQGSIPGGFIKRERMPSEHETLYSRMIDRPLRPLFDKNFTAETQVISTVISYDKEANPASAAMLGSSAALYTSDIPFSTPVAGVNVGLIDGKFAVNPSPSEMENSDLDLFLVGSKDAIVMVEAGAKQISEEVMIDALQFGHDAVQPLIELQEKLREALGKEKLVIAEEEVNAELQAAVEAAATDRLVEALKVAEKMERYAAVSVVKDAVIEELVTEENEEKGWTEKEVKGFVSDLKKKIMRSNILDTGVRVDGRDLTTVRPITCELGVLPKAHGSALFTRGETQALVATTLGTKDDEQLVDDPTGTFYKKFYLHYNFPPYSVGEVGRMAAPGRREIGHGNLAERGLKVVLPQPDKFPYTMRIVSDILESNGSSSMASVCGGSLSLMDAGVPVENAVAGIAMGLISEGDRYSILTDILGDEDHVGDMDFKVVGTDKGITALQMDIKVDGLQRSTLEEALTQAKEGRLHILSVMKESISGSREELSENAPRFIQYKIPSNKIRDLIGPGGKVIKGIQSQTGARVEINDSGLVNISSADQQSAEDALALVRDIAREPEVGEVYEGLVKRVVDFGAFVEILPGTEGLVHISEISAKRVENIEKEISMGQVIKVKVIGFDKRGKLKLSMKALIDA